MDTPHSLSIIIVSFNTRAHLERCLESIRDNAPRCESQVIVIDNASKDGSAELVEQKFKECLLIKAETNGGYGVAVNRAVRFATGDTLLLLNPDIEVRNGSLDTLLDFCWTRSRPGVIGAKLLYGDGRPQPSARRFLSAATLLFEASRLHLLLPRGVRSRVMLGTYWDQSETRRVPWVSGACHMIPKRVWDDAGPLTEDTFCGSDDYDYCYRVTGKGFEVWHCASSVMIHHCSVAVNDRWRPWQVEELAIHNFFVIIENHWPRWHVKLYCAAELLATLSELVRELFAHRAEQDVPSSPYRCRLRQRIRLLARLFVGRQRPIKRFEPFTHTRASVVLADGD
jgi:Predicted glycosyltransferases